MRYWQNAEVVFQKKNLYGSVKAEYPEVRKLTFETYGGNLEEAVKRCREQFKLGEEWELISSSAPTV